MNTEPGTLLLFSGPLLPDSPFSPRALVKSGRGFHSRLDALGGCVCIAAMKTKIFVSLLGALIVTAGCVSTVSGGKTGGVPFVKDTVEGRYERPLDEVFKAAKDVVIANGVLNKESILHSETNTVKTVEGKVNQRTVWVRVEDVDPKVTAVVVQTRTQGGAADVDLAHDIEKQIALKLVK